MRSKICAALIAASFAMPAMTQDDPFLKDEALQAEIQKSCAEGCVTFNRQEADTFQQQLDLLVAKKQAEAFAAGVRHQQQACASLI